MIKDTNKKLCNFLLYLNRNKAEIIKQLLYNTRLGQIKLEMTKKKKKDKIGSIIALYKTWRNQSKETK